MSEQIAVIPVFIASPSGLDDERKATYRIVQEINKSHARHWGCQLELVGWEETLPGHGRPQSLINNDLDRCDYFVGIIFDHWGSPPSGGGSYTSGFEEEFHRARDHINSGKMKDMVVFFKEIPAARLKDPGDSLKRVIAFRKLCFEERTALFKEFSTTAHYESFVRGKLEEIGWTEAERIRALNQTSAEDEQSEPVSSKDKKEAKTSGLIEEPSKKFLNGILSRPAGWDETSAFDVARFRLISTALHRQGNDEPRLGNHDANLLFKEKSTIEWAPQELQALLSCGVAGFKEQNVPLWYWLWRHEEVDQQDGGYINVLATIGADHERPNAIRLLQLLDRPVPILDGLSDDFHTIRIWLSDDTPTPSFDAAIEFLSAKSDPKFIPILKELATKSSRSNAINQVIVTTEAKNGGAKALRCLIELDLSDIREDLAETLFASPNSLQTTCLLECLEAKPAIIRRNALRLLNGRKATPIEAAESLLSDSDYGVRLHAAQALKNVGRELSDDILDKTLTATKVNFGRGLFGRGTTSDRSYREQYTRNQLCELSFDELRRRIGADNFFVWGEAEICFEKYASRSQDEIRQHLKDGFKSFFELRLTFVERLYSAGSDMIAKAKNLIGFLSGELTSKALDALCSLRKRGDLTLVRQTIDKFKVDASPSILSFLGKFGDWSDLDRIKGMGDAPQRGMGLLSIVTTKHAREKAIALIAVAANRLADLLADELNSDLRIQILLNLPPKNLSTLSDEVILAELHRGIDACRIVLALKCCAHLPKNRVATLLEAYVNHDGHRYYNTIHWLDLSASTASKAGKASRGKRVGPLHAQMTVSLRLSDNARTLVISRTPGG